MLTPSNLSMRALYITIEQTPLTRAALANGENPALWACCVRIHVIAAAIDAGLLCEAVRGNHLLMPEAARIYMVAGEPWRVVAYLPEIGEPQF